MNAPQEGADSRARRQGRLILLLLALFPLGVLVQQLSLAFQVLLGSPLNSDLPGFVAGARDMRFFYDSGLREPLQVFFIKLGLWLSDDVERVLRLLTVLQTLVAAVLVLVAGRRLLGLAVGLLALASFCVNPVVVFYGVSGMRAPLFTALLLGFVTVLFTVHTPRRPWVADGACGVLAALLVLTRVHAWIVVVGGLALLLLQRKVWLREFRWPTLRRAAWTLVLATVLYVPYPLLNDDRAFTHPVNFWRNIERYGEPRQFLDEPPLSTLSYVFENRTVVDVGRRVVENLWLYQTHYLPHYLRGVPGLAWLLLPGILVCILSRRLHVVGVLLLSLVQVVFILNLNPVAGHRGVEMRFVYQSFPVALLVLWHALAWPLGQGLLLLGQRRPALERWIAPVARVLLPPGGR
ncbi:MAG: glycosyltransferase family 39 protein [Pseudomonadota bacterium]